MFDIAYSNAIYRQVKESANYKNSKEQGYLQVDATTLITELAEKADRRFDSLQALEAYTGLEREKGDSLIEYLYELEEHAHWEKVLHDNTYNSMGNISNHADFRIYRSEVDDNYILVISFHLAGDVRVNYSDALVLVFDCESEHDIIEHMREEDLQVLQTTLDGQDYTFYVSMFFDTVEVYNDENDLELFGAFTEDEAVAELKSLLTKNNA